MAKWSQHWHSHECTLPFNRNNTTYTSLVHWFRREQIEIIFVWWHFKVLYTESVCEFLFAIFHSWQWEEIYILVTLISIPIHQRLLFSLSARHWFTWNGKPLNWDESRVLPIFLNSLDLLCLFYPLFVKSLPSSCTCCCFWSLSMPLSSMVRKLCCSPEFQAVLLFSATLTPAIPKFSNEALNCER